LNLKIFLLVFKLWFQIQINSKRISKVFSITLASPSQFSPFPSPTQLSNSFFITGCCYGGDDIGCCCGGGDDTGYCCGGGGNTGDEYELEDSESSSPNSMSHLHHRM
jgi:hypothetical protein